MKSKGLVVVGFVLIVAFILWALMTFFVVPQVSMRAGHIEISGIDPEDAIDLFMFSILLLKLTYIVDPAIINIPDGVNGTCEFQYP